MTMSEVFSDLFEKEKSNMPAGRGALIEGTISQITESVVVVNAGLKSEGVISIDEFLDKNNGLEINVGDKVEVVLEALEDGFGRTLMSRTRARQIKVWKRLEEAHSEGEIVTGTLLGRVKGGFTIDIEGVTAFLPGSLTDVKPMRDSNYTYLENKEIEFKVIKLDHQRNNIVVSRKAVLEDKYGVDRDEIEKHIQEGAVVKGIVKHLTDYGAFVGMNGFDGLLHITDMAWKRIRNPAELLAVGDEIEVKILKYDREKGRISLGLKQMTEDPWVQSVERYPVGKRVHGVVTSLTDYGCFVEIEEGIEGLVHTSEMDWVNKNVKPSKVVSVGDKVEVMVIGIDTSKRRISLGFKQCRPNPWQEFSEKYSKGDTFKGIVKSINDFGIFVRIPDSGIDGLVHTKDISAIEPPEQAILKYKRDDEVEVAVGSVDVNKERIALSIRELQDDFLQDYINAHPKNTSVKTTVSKIGDEQILVQLNDKVQGSIGAAEFKSEKDGKLTVSEGDEIEAKVLGINRKTFTIKLSVREKERDDHAKVVKEYSAKKKDSSVSLGELLKEKALNLFKKKQ